MARERAKYASARPSQAEEGGGKFTIPAGAQCTVTDIIWSDWREAGEGAIKGGREADDPALKVTVDIKGMDEPVTEFLGAGKGTRLVPARDGEHLEPADGSSAGAINKGCNAETFLESICDVKLHKKMAFDERLIDEPGISSITGLVFISGRKLVERNMDDGGGKKGRPTLVATEIVSLPKGSGGGRSSSRDEKDEKDERPARGRDRDRDEAKDTDADVEEAAEKALLEVLDMPKYSKGIHRDKAFAAVFNVVREEKNGKAIAGQVEDKDWIEGSRRPWTVDKDGTIEKA